jgi:hypothetical protein
MRASNVTIVVMGTIAVGFALAVALRWRHLATIAARDAPKPSERTAIAADAVRTIGVISTAGLVAGLAGAGVIGRLVMRVIGATSGDAAQGRVTEAGEVVGRITNGGTQGFIVFVGLFGGIAAALAFLVVRRWLPRTAGPAGLVLGVLLLGTIGVTDPMSPDNVDFRILTPVWLAVVMVALTAFLTATMFTALAARLDALSLTSGRSRYVAYVGLLLAALPSPLLLGAAAYIGGRIAWPGLLARWIERPAVHRLATVSIVLLVVVTSLATLNAAVSILRQ